LKHGKHEDPLAIPIKKTHGFGAEHFHHFHTPKLSQRPSKRFDFSEKLIFQRVSFWANIIARSGDEARRAALVSG
jgi:hypothetical protein